MPSLEQTVKDQFSKVFTSADWRLFKEAAEINFAEAAMLKKSSFRTVPLSRRLLIRNTRKRLFIGIGAELLLKAVYLKFGYGINKPLVLTPDTRLPFELTQVAIDQLNPNDTYTLTQLIDQLRKVVQFEKNNIVVDGLRIAKVFRNKEGHVVTQSHKFDPSSYRAIESSLVEIYASAFCERLVVRFSVEVGEKGVWRVGN